eukprot:IDg13741t1
MRCVLGNKIGNGEALNAVARHPSSTRCFCNRLTLNGHAQVREMYMRVIESTMENARNEMLENPGDEEMLGNLKRLEDRWRERLLHIQDFSEDPLLVRASSGGAARVRSTRANRSSAAPAAPALPASRMAQPAAAAA